MIRVVLFFTVVFLLTHLVMLGLVTYTPLDLEFNLMRYFQ
jgi:hypothetical protein